MGAMVQEIDKDGSGGIDFNEFCNKMARDVQVDHTPAEIERAFSTFAKKSPEGYIRVEELRYALQTYLHKEMLEVEIEQLLHHYRDNFVKLPGFDGEYFNYQDFVDLMSPIVDRMDGDG